MSEANSVRWTAGFGTAVVAVVALIAVAVAVQGVHVPALTQADSHAGSGRPSVALANDTRAATTAAPAGTAANATRTWHRYRSVVVFRDDDEQAWWRTDTMKAVHGIFANERVPVTDAVIPYAGGPNASITNDPGTCSYLRSLSNRHPGNVEYALHGYTHDVRTDFHNGSEFGGEPYAKQKAWIRRGTAAVENCTGQRPRTFVAPMDTYDRNTTRALAAENYTLVSGGAWFTKEYYDRTRPFAAGGVRHIPEEHAFVDDWANASTSNGSALRSNFDAAYRNRSLYVQMLHYWTFTTPSGRAKLRDLIDHMTSKPGVRFMTLGELGRGLANGTVERTANGWKVYETNARANATSSTPLPAVGPGNASAGEQNRSVASETTSGS